MDKLFPLIIIFGLLVAFGFFTAGLWISYRSKSRFAFNAPLPPITSSRIPLSLCGDDWNIIRNRIKSDIEFVTGDDRCVSVIMSAIDVAYEQGKKDWKNPKPKSPKRPVIAIGSSFSLY